MKPSRYQISRTISRALLYYRINFKIYTSELDGERETDLNIIFSHMFIVSSCTTHIHEEERYQMMRVHFKRGPPNTLMILMKSTWKSWDEWAMMLNAWCLTFNYLSRRNALLSLSRPAFTQVVIKREIFQQQQHSNGLSSIKMCRKTFDGGEREEASHHLDHQN